MSNYNEKLRFDTDLQAFAWAAIYKDGTVYTEYAADGGNNSFYDIDKEKLDEYVLVGRDSSVVGFDTKTGMLYINGGNIEIGHGDVMFTNVEGLTYNDIIQYKDASLNFSPIRGAGSSTGNIDQFNIGYKAKLQVNGVNYSVKFILGLPQRGGKAPFVNIRIVADADVDGDIVINYKSGTCRYPAPLKAGVAGEMNWVIQEV